MFYMVHFFGVFQAISSQKDKRLNFPLEDKGQMVGIIKAKHVPF
jgi:hypothetical protein